VCWERLPGIEQALHIRSYSPNDFDEVFAVINDAAVAYKDVIPPDRWHQPYMPRDELAAEITDHVEFWLADDGTLIIGVMGIQDRGDVALIRHAYVRTGHQHQGIGRALLDHVRGRSQKPLLIGTWAAASWAIDFYRHNGFTQLPRKTKERLLRHYWNIPERQIETSVVLADRAWIDRHG
jgi:GNAT superfamily N-acetyltransferase